MFKRIGSMLLAGAVATTALLVSNSGDGAGALAPSTCTGFSVGQTFSTIVVPAGQNCEIDEATVVGSVSLGLNASFKTCASTIGGGITGTQNYVNIDNATTVGGSISLTRPGAEIRGGLICATTETVEGYSVYLCPNHVGGSITVQNASRYSDEVSIGECGPMDVRGGVNLLHNSTETEVEDATIHGSVVCVGDNPTPELEDLSVGGAVTGCRASL